MKININPHFSSCHSALLAVKVKWIHSLGVNFCIAYDENVQ